MELLLPKVRAPVLPRPSYEVLNMAFGVGAGAHLFDKSRYRSHGAITTATWAAGLHGYCLDFNPLNPDHVVIPAAHTQLNFTTEDFSAVIRVYIDDITADRYFVSRGLWASDGWLFYVRNNGRVNFVTNQALAQQQQQSNLVAVGALAWYTVGFSRAGDTSYLYVNGVDETLAHVVHIDPLTNARHTTIGIDTTLADTPMDGRIEFLRIFRGIALTASEHLAWHNALA